MTRRNVALVTKSTDARLKNACKRLKDKSFVIDFGVRRMTCRWRMRQRSLTREILPLAGGPIGLLTTSGIQRRQILPILGTFRMAAWFLANTSWGNNLAITLTNSVNRSVIAVRGFTGSVQAAATVSVMVGRLWIYFPVPLGVQHGRATRPCERVPRHETQEQRLGWYPAR